MKNFRLQSASFACLILFFVIIIYFQYGCNTDSKASAALRQTAFAASEIKPLPAKDSTGIGEAVIANAATIISRPQVPVLCYHQIRDYRGSDSKTARDYIVPVASFSEQMQSLADSGYHTILPDQLYSYLTLGTPLPSRPVMITFDDSREDQYSAALPHLEKHGFKAVFFIMTVALNKPGYMSREQVKLLSDSGHIIGSHTYDHKNVKTYTSEDWVEQIQKPSQQLQAITGKPVDYFAFPFGLWNKDALVKLKDHDFKAVFQLAAARDENDPLYSIRRIIVPGGWSGGSLQKIMHRSFK